MLSNFDIRIMRRDSETIFRLDKNVNVQSISSLFYTQKKRIFLFEKQSLFEN
jgi:hypothetical protein